MGELVKDIGFGSFGAILGLVLGYLARLLLEQQFRKDLENYKRDIQKELEGYKHTFAVLANRLDFLHQERGKASLALVRQLKVAKAHVKLLVDAMPVTPVDHKRELRDAHAACTELHNMLVDTGFMFPEPIAEQMLNARLMLWSILDEATLLFSEASRTGKDRPSNSDCYELWKKLRAEFEPLETTMIAEIRTLLGAAEDER